MASVELLPHQADLVDDETSKILCLTGGVRSGKTYAAVWKAFRLAYANAPLAVLVVEPTYRQLTAVFLETWHRCMAASGIRYTHHKSDATVTWEMGGRTCKLILRSGDNPESLYGLTVAAALVDEWETLDERTVRTIRERVTDGVARSPQMVLLGTPEGFGWGSKWCEQADELGMRQLFARTKDNPYLSASYVSDLTAMLSDGEQRERLEGIRTPKEGRVYTRFDRRVHHEDAPALTYRDLPRVQLWCDFNVDAMTWAVVLKDENGAHIIQEILGSKNGTDVLEHGEYARSKIALLCNTSEREVMQSKVKIVCDAAGQQRSSNSNLTVVQILRSLGFDVRFPSANPSIEASVQSVQLALAKGRISIDTKACRYVTRCLEQQAYDKTTGKPEKLRGDADLSHGCLVAGTMIQTPHGERPIESIAPGDMVLTRDGYRVVTASEMTNADAEVFAIPLDNGRTLTGTADHPVWIDGRGFVRLDSVRYGDNLLPWQNKSASNSTASGSFGILNQKTEPLASISALAMGLGNSASSVFTARSGRVSMGQSQKAHTSITSMGTRSTTTRQTLNASASKSTSITTDTIPSHGPSTPLQKQERQPRHGTAATKAARGIHALQSAFSLFVQVCRVFANAALLPSRRAAFARQSSGSALTSASQSGVAMHAWTTSRKTALNAGRSSLATDTTRPLRAQSLVRALDHGVYVGRQAVFNLSVDGAPEYFANGVLVHNCDTLRYGVHMYWPGFSTRANQPVSTSHTIGG